jgi:hypothetical protein
VLLVIIELFSESPPNSEAIFESGLFEGWSRFCFFGATFSPSDAAFRFRPMPDPVSPTLSYVNTSRAFRARFWTFSVFAVSVHIGIAVHAVARDSISIAASTARKLVARTE